MSVTLPSLVEAVARALAEENGLRPDQVLTLGDKQQPAWQAFRGEARVAIEAVAKAGGQPHDLGFGAAKLGKAAAEQRQAARAGNAEDLDRAAGLLRVLAEAADA